ncbi:glutathione metabolism protein [Epibacterium sp. SM1979]|uniref:Glutathione metabolism protein n=1 Tax=Tritonibacter litoralis TaxID=2662264 RepID=A0A843YDA7_9RHOB|nr:MAPEG family protein [Tritonibacter litoralis]MQQ07645.1 glutathione metabolism protein [Tritonibacter litoralis]
MFVVTSFYAAVLTIFLIFLSARVIILRNSERVAIGTGKSEPLLRAARVQGNFSEYVPIGLVLMALCEAQGVASWQIHCLGAMLLVGRVSHFIGVSGQERSLIPRIVGMVLTFTMLALAAVRLLVLALN